MDVWKRFELSSSVSIAKSFERKTAWKSKQDHVQIKEACTTLKLAFFWLFICFFSFFLFSFFFKKDHSTV